MRKALFAAILNFTFFTAYAQTDGVQIDYSITPPTRSNTAILQLNSTAQGFLPPRVALVASNNSTTPINAPVTGLMVYNTATAGTAPNNVTPGLYFWNGSSWQKVNAGAALGFVENRAVDNVFTTGQSASFDITGNGEVGGTLEVGGQTTLGTVTPTANAMLTINAHGTNTQRSGIDITMTSPGSNSTGINITSAAQQARGLMYSNSTNGLSNALWGTGAELTTTNIVAGYTAYRNSSGLSYGVYGINGTNASYATNASTWAAFLQGRTVISSESSPTSPLGVDLEVRNTTTGAAAPATIQLRQTTSLTTNGTVLANLDFGDNHQTNAQARIQAIRGAAGGAGDLPSSLLFYSTPDASAAMAERMRIASNGNVGIGTTAPNSPLTVRTTVATANARTSSLSNAIGDVLFELATSKGATTNNAGDITTQIGQAYNGGTITEGIRFFRGGGATDGAMAFVTNAGTERMRINNAGTVSVNSLAGTGSRFVLADASGNLSAGTSIGTGIVTGTGTTDYLARWTSASALGTGATRDNGTDVGIGMAPGTYKLSVAGNTFTSGKYFGHLNVDDTRAVNTAPTGYNNEVAFDFKLLSTIGAPGSGSYGGLITMAPWGDNSGDASHQLFLNEGGIFWRQGQPDAATWGSWDRVLTEATGDIDYIQNQTAGAQAGSGFWTAGTGRTNGTLTGGGTTVISSDNIQVNDGGTGNRYAYIDLEGDDTYTDYGLRLIRENAGPNTNSTMIHRGTGNLQLTTSEAAPILFSTSNAERMRIAPTGNVGIGTTVPTLGKLQLNAGDIAIRLSENAGAQAAGGHANLGSITFYGHNRGIGNNSARIRVGSTGWDDAGYFAFETSTDGVDAAERMRITEAGNVGIGTTAPATNMLLDVNGSMLARKYVVQDGVDGTNARGIWLWDEADSNWGMYMGTNGAGKSLANGTAVAGGGFTSHAFRLRAYNGAGNGFIFENSSEVNLLSIRSDNGRATFRGGVLFNCVGCGSTSTIDGDGSSNWGDLTIQGRVISTNSNMHLSPPNGSKVIINTAYRAAGGATGSTGLDIEDGGLRTRKNYRWINRYGSTGGYGWGSQTHDLGNWDFCAVGHFGFRNTNSNTDEDDDVQCAVYPQAHAGPGESDQFDSYFTYQFNQRPRWYMYLEGYADTNATNCAASCMNLE